ncbi:hypothetical protein FD19_GL001361 [Lacticaseibacillus thailandensis DSM 22698 = JCM 13996]|uniref:Uncharacterized protein n=1 Tax=Lacticaseibacillus thailandensis DSM 22698 = JCM 13996 TaxID=1423810 RepID=A0A0R2C6Q5_9LACO|nr:hypothetical protein FD19_GL001361 [Lacticaseibacillus thailandensis DSM 22698 = JCM 13996]
MLRVGYAQPYQHHDTSNARLDSGILFISKQRGTNEQPASNPSGALVMGGWCT